MELFFVQHMEMTGKHCLPGWNRLREFWYVQQLLAANMFNPEMAGTMVNTYPRNLGFTEIKHKKGLWFKTKKLGKVVAPKKIGDRYTLEFHVWFTWSFCHASTGSHQEHGCGSRQEISSRWPAAAAARSHARCLQQREGSDQQNANGDATLW